MVTVLVVPLVILVQFVSVTKDIQVNIVKLLVRVFVKAIIPLVAVQMNQMQ
jgi:hypothetical protein